MFKLAPPQFKDERTALWKFWQPTNEKRGGKRLHRISKSESKSVGSSLKHFFNTRRLLIKQKYSRQCTTVQKEWQTETSYLFRKYSMFWFFLFDDDRHMITGWPSYDNHHMDRMIDWSIIFDNIESPSVCDEYIRIFECSNILVTNIYSDIRSYQFFIYEYIQTFVHVQFVKTNIFVHECVKV